MLYNSYLAEYIDRILRKKNSFHCRIVFEKSTLDMASGKMLIGKIVLSENGWEPLKLPETNVDKIKSIIS